MTKQSPLNMRYNTQSEPCVMWSLKLRRAVTGMCCHILNVGKGDNRIMKITGGLWESDPKQQQKNVTDTHLFLCHRSDTSFW